MILAPPGLDYITAFFACQFAGVTAAPAYPPRNAKHMDRLQGIASDRGAKAVLTIADLVGKLSDWGADQLPHTIAVDLLSDDVADMWRDPNVGAHDLAFLQYTSGTTGTPKGVMVAHDNLMASLAAAATRGRLGLDDAAVSWLPPYHDLGLVGSLLQPVFAGYQSVMMAPAAFLQKPSRWIRALSDHRATITLAPNFGYELACSDATITDAESLDLSSLRHAFSGGEPPRASTLDRFAQRFGMAGFQSSAFKPCYGLAETTLQVTLSQANVAPRRIRVSERPIEPTLSANLPGGSDHTVPEIVSNGPAIEGHDLRIVDPKTRLECPAGMVGEVWVAGPTIARGYWNRADLTSETFHARLADDAQAGPFLRTGDLGILADGELYVLGRIKEQSHIGPGSPISSTSGRSRAGPSQPPPAWLNPARPNRPRARYSFYCGAQMFDHLTNKPTLRVRCTKIN